MSATQDRPRTDPWDFAVARESHDISITGKATGDYRIEGVSLVKAAQQSNQHVLVLEVIAKDGPATPKHLSLIRTFPLEFVQRPGSGYTHVEIVNGSQRFTLKV